MDRISIPKSFMYRAGLDPRVQSGVSISFQAVKQIRHKLWIINLRGENLEVLVKERLIPGAKYKAVLLPQGKLIHLKMDNHATQELPANAAPITTPQFADRHFFAALVHAGISLDEDSLHGYSLLYKRLSNTPLGRRLLAILLGKGLGPDVSGMFKEIFPLFSGEFLKEKSYQQDSGKKNKEKQSKTEVSQLVKESVRSQEEQASLSYLFNHLKSKGEHWLMFPLPAIEQGGAMLQGVLRLVFPNSHTDIPDRASITLVKSAVTFPDSGKSWRGHFLISLQPTPWRLSMYRPEKECLRIKSLDKKILKKIKKNLNNLGVELDDIKREETFDGAIDLDKLETLRIDREV